jgi:hypothetical protein
MTDQFDELRSSIVAAVQQELSRFSGQVSLEIQRVRDELAAERATRTKTEDQIRSYAPMLEQRITEFAGNSKRRFDEIELRIGRIVDEANVGMTAAVEAAARPVLKSVEERQERVELEVAGLDRTVRKFDAQASQIVAHLNAVSEATESRLDEVSNQIGVQIDGRLSLLATRLDEVSAQAARHQSEVSNIVGQRVDQAEERVNERILAAESRIKEDTGQRIADIDAYVGRISAGLDDSVLMLNDRITAADGRFADVDAAIDTINNKLDEVDVDAIDEMKERVASAAGEVELLRIENERYQASIGETIDKTVARLVDVETQLQEHHMDVDTAVQLERLEEVERAIIALDPAQFVRRDELPGGSVTPSAASPLSAPQPFAPMTLNVEI